MTPIDTADLVLNDRVSAALEVHDVAGVHSRRHAEDLFARNRADPSLRSQGRCTSAELKVEKPNLCAAVFPNALHILVMLKVDSVANSH